MLIEMVYSHIVWDFNGTLLNDVDAAIKAINTLLRRRKMKSIDHIDDYHEVFECPFIHYYKNIGFEFEKESYHDIAIEWVDQYLIYAKNTTLCDGVNEVLSVIQEMSIPQIVLSATESKMLTKQIEDLGIANYFQNILGLDNIQAYSKLEITNEWARNETPKKALLIGDTTHDFEVAMAIGATCVLVASGHQNKETLEKCGCKVMENITEVLEVITHG